MSNDSRSRQYRDQLLDAADGGVDFAGHYVLAEIGCGAGCVIVAAIDAKTGIVIWLPATVSNWPTAITEPIEHRRDSRLVIVHGQLDETGTTGPHHYLLNGRAFVRLPR